MIDVIKARTSTTYNYGTKIIYLPRKAALIQPCFKGIRDYGSLAYACFAEYSVKKWGTEIML
jgi:hypothetical protein